MILAAWVCLWATLLGAPVRGYAAFESVADPTWTRADPVASEGLWAMPAQLGRTHALDLAAGHRFSNSALALPYSTSWGSVGYEGAALGASFYGGGGLSELMVTGGYGLTVESMSMGASARYLRLAYPDSSAPSNGLTWAFGLGSDIDARTRIDIAWINVPAWKPHGVVTLTPSWAAEISDAIPGIGRGFVRIEWPEHDPYRIRLGQTVRLTDQLAVYAGWLTRPSQFSFGVQVDLAHINLAVARRFLTDVPDEYSASVQWVAPPSEDTAPGFIQPPEGSDH